MRLILVHGINNEKHTKQEIEDQWVAAIKQGWSNAGLAQKTLPPVTTAYYAKELAEAAVRKHAAIGMGGPAAAAEANIAYAFLREYQDAAGISDDEVTEVARESGVAPAAIGMGPPHEGWVIALATALEKILPSKGKYIADLFLRQAAVYLDDRAVTLSIDNLVRSQIFPTGQAGPCIILAHSLGTIVSYRLAIDDPPAGLQVPLFVTMGSPLGIGIVKNRLKARAAFPRPPIAQWINAVCKDDFVTLNRTLKAEQLGYDGVENVKDVVNDMDDKHAIGPYLGCASIARALHAALPG